MRPLDRDRQVLDAVTVDVGEALARLLEVGHPALHALGTQARPYPLRKTKKPASILMLAP
jgi:hypothetical protein